ncbi:MAG: DUF2203 domain-containing protein [Planctomycetota bacterium]|nr:DUF2203 domain-containing protein [Planctomycetota bacterium]
MKGKIFTPDEANRMLPLVSRIAEDIVATYADVNRALQAFEAEKARAEADESRQDVLRERDEEVAAVLDRFQGLIEEIEALGGTVKDYESGMIDFYGEVDGEIVYLCWQRGEDEISHWHRLEEGYGRRRPLTVSTPAL